VSSDGAATGTKKFIKENFFYFLGSGGTLTGVVGINISGTSPQLDLADNCFRPNRAWVGGAGTAQIVDTSTGRLSGSIVTASALNSFPLLSGVGLSLSYSGNALTQANVAAGVFTIPVDSLLEFIPTVATNVTQIAHEAGGRDRIIVIRISGANATFVKGALMALSANFNPASGGSLTLLLETTAGTTKATELARTAF
jgi:hypothetical protein